MVIDSIWLQKQTCLHRRRGIIEFRSSVREIIDFVGTERRNTQISVEHILESYRES